MHGKGMNPALLAVLLLPWLAFIASAVVGYMQPNYDLVRGFAEAVRSEFAGLDPFAQVLFIFASNMLTTMLVYLLSLAVVVPGMVLIIFNGYLVGAVISFAVNEAGLTLVQALALILPHGSIEIPAFLGAASSGVYCFLRCRSVSYFIRFTVRVVAVVAVLLMVAAVVEVFITPVIGRSVGAPI